MSTKNINDMTEAELNMASWELLPWQVIEGLPMSADFDRSETFRVITCGIPGIVTGDRTWHFWRPATDLNDCRMFEEIALRGNLSRMYDYGCALFEEVIGQKPQSIADRWNMSEAMYVVMATSTQRLKAALKSWEPEQGG